MPPDNHDKDANIGIPKEWLVILGIFIGHTTKASHLSTTTQTLAGLTIMPFTFKATSNMTLMYSQHIYKIMPISSITEIHH